MWNAAYGLHSFLAALHGEEVKSSQLKDGEDHIWYNCRTVSRRRLGYFEAFAEMKNRASVWILADEIRRKIAKENASVDIVKLLVPETYDGEFDQLNVTKSTLLRKYYASATLHSYNETLTLADSYPDFLATLGSHTRRDIRRFRRRAEAAGFCHEIRWNPQPSSTDEWNALCYKARRKASGRTQISQLQLSLNREKANFHSLIYNASRCLVACCAGFIHKDSVIIFYQLNDPDHRRDSLSLLNNGFLIEALIARGIREFILPLGGAGLLTHFCRSNRYAEVMLIRNSPVPLLKALCVSLLRPNSAVGIGARKICAQR